MKKKVLKLPLNKKVGQVLVKNSPAILTGLGVAGMLTTTILAVQATPKALNLLEEKFLELGGVTPTKKETIQTAWKCYIPSAIMGTLTVACIISANKVSTKRNAALASLYSITEKSLKQYQSKVIETIGVNKEQKIRDSVAEEKLREFPVSKNEVIITGNGEMLCYDVMSGRYFKNDIEQIRRIQNDLNRDLLTDMWLDLNDLYYALGLSGIELGAMMGWSIDTPLDVNFSSMISDEGKPCLVLSYEVVPKGY